MKKLVLATLVAIFALAANATVVTDTNLTNVTSARVALTDNRFYNTVEIDHPLFAKGKGSADCKGLPSTCGEMANCSQAKQALACGNKRLDRDNDGVPCESLCPGG